MNHHHQGCALLRLLVFLSLTGFICGTGITHCLATWRNSNATKACQVLRGLHQAQITYSQGVGKGHYASDFWGLAGIHSISSPLENRWYPESPEQAIARLTKEWGNHQVILHVKDQTSTKAASYQAISRPLKASGLLRSSNDIFYLDETGIIRHSGSPTVWPDENSEPVR